MQDKKQSLVPELRFPGFEGEWEMKRIEDSFQERVEKNRGDLPLLSLGEEGLMLQSESQRKDNSNSDKSKYLRVAVGDIAYNTMRMWQGRCVHCDIEGIVSPTYTVCKPKEGIDPLFHYYLFKTNQMIGIFHQHSQGLVNDTLNLKYEAFSKIKYLVPSLPEQQKIAECLSSVDDLIQAEADQLQALKDHKKGLMQQLFPQEGETTPKLRFPGCEGEWEEKKLGEVCNVVDDKCDIGSLTIVTYISTENMLQDFEGVKIASKLPNSGSFTRFNKGDILFSNIRPYLKKVWQAVFDGAASNDVIVFRTLDGYDRLFVSQVIKSDRFIAHSMSGAKGVKIPRGDKKMMLDYLFSIPSLPEQQKIAECLSSLDEGIAAQQEKVEALKEHKKGLMQKLFPNLQ